jgi:dTDP-4-amino-4,6-dideoxygalactose transaminase
LLRAVTASLDPAGDHEAARAMLAARFGARSVTLTDSGTSALVLALRCAVGNAGVVALPAYGCFDLAAAAVFAGLRVLLYDVEPATLSADLDSVRRTLQRGAAAVVVVHLFGYPSDVRRVRAVADEHGASVIEDAAQGAGGLLDRQLLGAFGPLTVLSFGRGKGLTAGSGGALLAMTEEWSGRLAALGKGPSAGRVGWTDLGMATALWLIGRPSLYRIPASVPQLHLGETVYRQAHEPRRMSGVATSLLRSALPLADRDANERRATAGKILAGFHERDLAPITAIADGVPGYLRLAVRDLGKREPLRELGIMRGYPTTLGDLPQLQQNLCAGQQLCSGAAHLRDALFTLPTHDMLSERDVEGIRGWMQAGRMREVA